VAEERKGIGHNPSPFTWSPNPMDFWEVELTDLLRKNEVLVYQADFDGSYKLVGDGVRLRLPFSTIIDLSNEELVDLVIRGIKVSKAHPELLKEES
jgi:hypothetical protein